MEFRGWYKDETGILLYLMMEYFEQGDLGQFIKEFGPQGEENAKEITRQLLEGLVVLHQRQICHRDLKPQVWALPGREFVYFTCTKHTAEYTYCI